jgi:hypothetical protein
MLADTTPIVTAQMRGLTTNAGLYGGFYCHPLANPIGCMNPRLIVANRPHTCAES